MNGTTIRAGLALAGTAAVLGTAALTAGGVAQASPQQASTASTTTASTSTTKGGGHGDSDRAARGRAGVTYLVECVDDNRVRKPRTFTLACADAGQRLEKLTWKRWGYQQAFATGIVRENVSTPMSKGDKWISYKVAVKATNLVDGEASATYNKLIVRVVGKKPAGVDRVQVFDLPGNTPTRHVKKHTNPAPIHHTTGWSDGHEGMSDDPIVHDSTWNDGHAGMSDDPIVHDSTWNDGHAGMDK